MQGMFQEATRQAYIYTQNVPTNNVVFDASYTGPVRSDQIPAPRLVGNAGAKFKIIRLFSRVLQEQQFLSMKMLMDFSNMLKMLRVKTLY